MGQDIIGQNMMIDKNMGGNLMGRNIYNVMSNRGMTSDMPNIMGQRMGSSLIGRDMMGQDMTSDMMLRSKMGHQDMTQNMMYSNQMSSNMMNSNKGLIGQQMMQQMEMKHVPETYTSTRLF